MMISKKRPFRKRPDDTVSCLQILDQRKRTRNVCTVLLKVFQRERPNTATFNRLKSFSTETGDTARREGVLNKSGALPSLPFPLVRTHPHSVTLSSLQIDAFLSYTNAHAYHSHKNRITQNN